MADSAAKMGAIVPEEQPRNASLSDVESGMNEEDEDTDVESDEDPVQLIQEFGSHPLMERAQKALVTQLRAEYERITEELRQKVIRVCQT